jgi:hypothetical protein
MAANDMYSALKHPHPEVLLSKVGDDTLTALAQLATIFKNKFQEPSAPELIQAPLKAAENKPPAALAQPILTFPCSTSIKQGHKHQKVQTHHAIRHYFKGWSHQ